MTEKEWIVPANATKKMKIYPKMKNKIIWKKPDYKNQWKRVSEKEIDELCIDRAQTGDIRINREQSGRKIRFFVFRLEKVGELVEGIETLSRQRAIEELLKLEKDKKIK